MSINIQIELARIKVLSELRCSHIYIIENGIYRQRSFVPYNTIIREINISRAKLKDKGYYVTDGILKKLA